MIELAADGLPKILPAYDDGVFKSMLTRPESKESLADIISSFLGVTITDIEIRGNELPIHDIDVKREIFDISCRATDGKSQFAVEMQAAPMEGDSFRNEHSQIRHRSVYCLTDLHANQPGRGLNYRGFAKSYQITICNYCPFKEEHKLLEKFQMRNQRGIVLADAITSIFVDLSLTEQIVKKSISEMTASEMWAVFLAKANEPEYDTLISKIIKIREGISMAQTALSTISQDEHERARFRSHKIWQLDREHEQAIWIESGRNESKFAVARNLIQMDIPFDKIIAATGLTRVEIESLKH